MAAGARHGQGLLRSRLARRLLALFLACALLPILVLGLLAFRQVTHNLRVEAERQLYAQTKLFALGVRERLALLESGFELLIARLDRLGPDAERWPAAFEGTTLGRQLSSLAWQDDDTTTVLIGKPLTVPGLEPEAAEHLASGAFMVVADEDGGPLTRILVARAALAADGREGVLWGEVEPRYMWALGADRALPPQTELAVLDERGFLIRTPGVPASVAERLRASSKSGDGRALEWRVGDDALIASHRAVPMATYGAGTWIVSVSQRLDQALGPLQRFRRDFPRIVLILGLVAVLVSLSQIRRSLGPLDALRAATRRVAEGDFSQPVTLSSGDEFEALGDAFNRMAQEIERRLRVAETQAAMDRSALTDAGADAAVETLLDGLGAILPADHAQVVIESPRGERRHFRRSVSSPAPAVEGDDAATGRILEVPVETDDRTIGSLGLERSAGPGFEPADRSLVAELASHLALVLNHLQLRAIVDRERERLRTLVEHLPHGVLVLDGAHRLLLANRLGREYRPELTSAEIGEKVTTLGERPLAAWQDDVAGTWQELELPGPPSRVFVVAVVGLGAGDGGEGMSVAGSIVMLRDVTAERQADERMKRQERLVTVGRMAAGIAHDLNNVLQAILMGADLMAARTQAREAELILSQSRRASDMIRQILDFAHESTSRPEDTDLAALVLESVEMIAMTFEAELELRLELPSSPLRAWVDPAQIQQVVHNLAINARDAMSGTGRGILTVGLRALEGDEASTATPVGDGRTWCELTVSDTGEGIPPSVQPHIFDPFYTTKKLGVGTGLGLAQVLGIVDRHGGTIDFTTGSDGTVFTVLLPMTDAVDEAVAAAPAARLPARPQAGAILVVDDDAIVLKTVESGLRALGFEVITASDGDAAWARWQQDADRIDLVLADVRMPGLSGVELLQRIREQDPDRPVVLMSGYAGIEIDVETLQAIHGWLEKPFTVDDLARVTREAIDAS